MLWLCLRHVASQLKNHGNPYEVSIIGLQFLEVPVEGAEFFGSSHGGFGFESSLKHPKARQVLHDVQIQLDGLPTSGRLEARSYAGAGTSSFPRLGPVHTFRGGRMLPCSKEEYDATRSVSLTDNGPLKLGLVGPCTLNTQKSSTL